MAMQGVTQEPQEWPTCEVENCIGVCIEGHPACIVHVNDEGREAFIHALKPGATLDLRGALIDPELLDAILAAMQFDDSPPKFGVGQFTKAQFTGDANFEDVHFREVSFREAQFTGETVFSGARFAGDSRVEFSRAKFLQDVEFSSAHFLKEPMFDEVQFRKDVFFDEVRFDTDAMFGGARFGGDAYFTDARFGGLEATFHWTHFEGNALFNDAQFACHAVFTGAQFVRDSRFDARYYDVQFLRGADFTGAHFGNEVFFDRAQFDGEVAFDGLRVERDASFADTKFTKATKLGPLVIGELLSLKRAWFGAAPILEVAAARLSCAATSFTKGATLRIRFAEVMLDSATFEGAWSISFAEAPFSWPVDPVFEALDESMLRRNRELKPRMLSLRLVDVDGLVLTNLDLAACLFSGAHNLDKLIIEGPPPFADTPSGWKFGRVGGQGVPIWRWTRRQALAEERQWRARMPLSGKGIRRPHPKRSGWDAPRCQTPEWVAEETGQPVQRLSPDYLASIYRSLRKAQEDNKNEPGAADLYYGEMEMRRLARKTTRSGERFVLTLYWLVSGYGLRGLRAFAWLVVAVIGLAIALQRVGFTSVHPSFRDVLIFTAQSTLSLNSLNKALTEHVTWAGEGLRLVVRLLGPLLLGLALLAVRNRVKR